MNNRSTLASSVGLFLLGLGSATKLFFFGTISFSELAIFLIAPFLFLKYWRRMRQEGFLTFIYMLASMMAGMLVSAYWNHSPFSFTFKLFAVFYGMFAFYVVFYCLIHDNFNGIGWFFIGGFISGIITIWYFNPTADVSESGFAQIANAQAEDVILGPLFWIGKVRGLGQLPILGMYLKTPLIYSVSFPIIFVIFALFASVSGRGQSMCVLIGGLLMFMCGKSRRKMRNIGRKFLIFMISGVIILFCYKIVYSYAAGKGYLGYDARIKYEHQIDRGKGAFSMLVAGRTEFFIALTAIVDHPIVGFGPRAEDTEGYTENFLLKYGTNTDIAGYYYYSRKYASQGLRYSIPTHSHIMAAWLWCGLPGLIFFLWVLYVIYRHLRCFSSSVPQWFGYFAITIPGTVWSIFFNPISSRSALPMLMVLMFFARAVKDGKMQLPLEMELEARKYE